MKNLNSDNHQAILQRLQFLDTKYDLKKKIILEVGTVDNYVKNFVLDGWHVSYYLPTGIITKNLIYNDKKEMIKLAKKLAQSAKKVNIAALSFDGRVYDFIRDYLDKEILDTNMVYHTWGGPDLKSSKFQEDIYTHELYLNKKIKTILYHYESDFKL